ncbi:MAG: polyprenol phosphomannose-dependent alpha 1,6 mannosyltransferase MptB [Sciscionella sp.]|nr:polyprenol phosphomannose-dependent alpha 1,6 mannosyltransferase MptB [Sciscionella sp.]
MVAGDTTARRRAQRQRARQPESAVVPDHPVPLDATELRQFDVLRRFGTVGALLVAVGSLGAGAEPVYNPITTMSVLGMFTRLPTVALACAYAGMGMVVIAWLWLGRFVRPGRTRLLSRGQMDRTLVMWTAPLVIVPPMFSRDVYSYLAQCKIAALGMNPYQLGPAQALGVADPLTRGVTNIWRDTPAPYGPLFLTVCRGITGIAGDHVVTGVILQRLLELIGVGLIIWALPRLARRFDVQPVSALWLGAANPLVLWHLVAGAHNEALMIGLMLAGFEVAIRRLPKVSPGDTPPTRSSGSAHPTPPRMSRAEIGYLLAGTVLIIFGAGVKVSALAALAFLGVMVARRLGGRIRHLAIVGVAMTAIAGVVLTVISLASGLGFGWISALGTPGLVQSWQAPTTALGMLAGAFGVLIGLGNHTNAAVTAARLLGDLATAVLSIKLIFDAFRGRFNAMVGLGLCLGVIVICGVMLQPWYVLWAAIPLAAGVGANRFRTIAAVVSALMALISTAPTGATFSGHTFVVTDAVVAAVVVVALALFAMRRKIPIVGPLRWRRPAAVNAGDHPNAGQ